MNLKGLSCATLEDVFALEPHEIDLGTACLLADREVDAALDVAACTRRLDQLAREFLERCEPGESIEETLHHLVETASEAPRSGDKIVYQHDQSLLSRVIEQGRGNCVSLSVLHLAIAERAGFELDGVLLPLHFKVRHESAAGDYEIETTSGRVSRGRDDTTTKFFSERDRGASRFGETLSRRDTLAVYVASSGLRLHRVGNSARGLELCRLSLAAWPDLSAAHMYVGDIETHRDATSGAGIPSYQRALEARPDDAFVWLNLATAYVRSGSCANALESCSKALELDRDLAPAWLQLAKVHLRMGALEEAIAACRIARGLRPERLHNSVALAIIGSYGSFRRFEAETYDTESSIYLELSRGMMAETSAGTEHSEKLRQTNRWLALCHLTKALAITDASSLGAAQRDYQSAMERMHSDPSLAADRTIAELSEAAAAHLKALEEM